MTKRISHRKCFVEVDDCGRWFSTNVLTIAQQALRYGYEPVKFHPDEIDSLEITKETPFKGSIRTMRKIFDKLGVKQPKNMDFPEIFFKDEQCQKRFLGRKVWKSSFGQLRKFAKLKKNQKTTVHIKPLDIQKGFSGQSVDLSDLKQDFAEYPDDYKLLVSEYITPSYEKRIYVFGGYKYRSKEEFSRQEELFIREVINFLHYNHQEMQHYVFDITQTPCEDFGITKPVIVEFNDAFSAGKKNIDDVYYGELFFARLGEITGGGYDYHP